MRWLRCWLALFTRARARAIYRWLKRPFLPTHLSRQLQIKPTSLRVQREVRLARKRHEEALVRLRDLTALNRKTGVHWCIHRHTMPIMPFEMHRYSIPRVPPDVHVDGRLVRSGYADALQLVSPIPVIK